jgi:hypothetical protein
MRLHFVACLKEKVRKNLTTSKNTSIHTLPEIILYDMIMDFKRMIVTNAKGEIGPDIRLRSPETYLTYFG